METGPSPAAAAGIVVVPGFGYLAYAGGNIAVISVAEAEAIAPDIV